MTTRGSVSWSYATEQQFRKLDGGAMTSPVALIAAREYERDTAIPAGMLSGAHRLAVAMQEWAQMMHAWTNRTGEAERGLVGSAEDIDGRGVVAVLASTAPHGFFLERNPEWSVLDKAQQAMSARAGEIMAGEVSLELRGRGSKFRGAGGRFVSGS